MSSAHLPRRKRSGLLRLAGRLLTPLLVMGASLTDAAAEPFRPRAGVNGYFRLMGRPDFQGGDGRLGYWNLYGRLLNESAYAELDVRVNLLEPTPGTNDPWTSAHLRLAGGSVSRASPTNGSLADFRLEQLFVKAGNVLIPNVTWQLGTLDTWFGDLGLYDFRPTALFFETLGLSGRWQKGPVDFLLGVGDSGFRIRGLEYSPILTAGGYIRATDRMHVDFGVGGQVLYEPSVQGSKNAPLNTPGIDYEDWIRGEVVQRYIEANPNRAEDFPDPEPASSLSGKAIVYLGFGNWGPLRWNSIHASFQRMHPQTKTTETFQGKDYTLYVQSLTDQRYSFFIGNETQLRLIEGRWDMAIGAVYGNDWDDDNVIKADEWNRWYVSGVLRTQVYLSPTVHLLLESSAAREYSKNGNLFRNRGDSIFQGTGGVADSRGLENGDSDTRETWQGKGGFVLNPLGPGIYVRPSLRLLYGVQYSTQSNAFGNSFVESVSDLNEFGAFETHWHHIIALEAEAWF